MRQLACQIWYAFEVDPDLQPDDNGHGEGSELSASIRGNEQRRCKQLLSGMYVLFVSCDLQVLFYCLIQVDYKADMARHVSVDTTMPLGPAVLDHTGRVCMQE